jgi:hypothetical protein
MLKFEKFVKPLSKDPPDVVIIEGGQPCFNCLVVGDSIEVVLRGNTPYEETTIVSLGEAHWCLNLVKHFKVTGRYTLTLLSNHAELENIFKGELVVPVNMQRVKSKPKKKRPQERPSRATDNFIAKQSILEPKKEKE